MKIPPVRWTDVEVPSPKPSRDQLPPRITRALAGVSPRTALRFHTSGATTPSGYRSFARAEASTLPHVFANTSGEFLSSMVLEPGHPLRPVRKALKAVSPGMAFFDLLRPREGQHPQGGRWDIGYAITNQTPQLPQGAVVVGLGGVDYPLPIPLPRELPEAQHDLFRRAFVMGHEGGHVLDPHIGTSRRAEMRWANRFLARLSPDKKQAYRRPFYMRLPSELVAHTHAVGLLRELSPQVFGKQLNIDLPKIPHSRLGELYDRLGDIEQRGAQYLRPVRQELWDRITRPLRESPDAIPPISQDALQPQLRRLPSPIAPTTLAEHLRHVRDKQALFGRPGIIGDIPVDQIIGGDFLTPSSADLFEKRLRWKKHVNTIEGFNAKGLGALLRKAIAKVGSPTDVGALLWSIDFEDVKSPSRAPIAGLFTSDSPDFSRPASYMRTWEWMARRGDPTDPKQFRYAARVFSVPDKVQERWNRKLPYAFAVFAQHIETGVTAQVGWLPFTGDEGQTIHKLKPFILDEQGQVKKQFLGGPASGLDRVTGLPSGLPKGRVDFPLEVKDVRKVPWEVPGETKVSASVRLYSPTFKPDGTPVPVIERTQMPRRPGWDARWEQWAEADPQRAPAYAAARKQVEAQMGDVGLAGYRRRHSFGNELSRLWSEMSWGKLAAIGGGLFALNRLGAWAAKPEELTPGPPAGFPEMPMPTPELRAAIDAGMLPYASHDYVGARHEAMHPIGDYGRFQWERYHQGKAGLPQHQWDNRHKAKIRDHREKYYDLGNAAVPHKQPKEHPNMSRAGVM